VFGFIIGWIFRAFIKTMALVTILGVGILFALSYFNVIDFESTRKAFESRMGWVTDQGERLKNVATTYVPSSVPALLGGFLGFRRKLGIPSV
jgi:uncharacterized membrane protein (Fun14 family)